MIKKFNEFTEFVNERHSKNLLDYELTQISNYSRVTTNLVKTLNDKLDDEDKILFRKWLGIIRWKKI